MQPESWDEVRPVLGDIGGGEEVTVHGYGFILAVNTYECVFERGAEDPLVVPARVPSSYELLCVTPPWSNDTAVEGPGRYVPVRTCCLVFTFAIHLTFAIRRTRFTQSRSSSLCPMPSPPAMPLQLRNASAMPYAMPYAVACY
eukprot:696967-Rhodomonas_salina.1